MLILDRYVIGPFLLLIKFRIFIGNLSVIRHLACTILRRVTVACYIITVSCAVCDMTTAQRAATDKAPGKTTFIRCWTTHA
jgi:hypothetical protein